MAFFVVRDGVCFFGDISSVHCSVRDVETYHGRCGRAAVQRDWPPNRLPEHEKSGVAVAVDNPLKKPGAAAAD